MKIRLGSTEYLSRRESEQDQPEFIGLFVQLSSLATYYSRGISVLYQYIVLLVRDRIICSLGIILSLQLDVRALESRSHFRSSLAKEKETTNTTTLAKTRQAEDFLQQGIMKPFFLVAEALLLHALASIWVVEGFLASRSCSSDSVDVKSSRFVNDCFVQGQNNKLPIGEGPPKEIELTCANEFKLFCKVFNVQCLVDETHNHSLNRYDLTS
jgi:hypothetical protein